MVRATFVNPTEKVAWRVSTITGKILHDVETTGVEHTIEYESTGPSNLLVISAISEDGHVESKLIFE